MRHNLAMPQRRQIEQSLLRAFLRQGGVIQKFNDKHDLVNTLADEFSLNLSQRTACLQTVYRKENRVKNAVLWHRLLFRAADALANRGLVSKPGQTFKKTARREWMLTEKGLTAAMGLCDLPLEQKAVLSAITCEVQTAANQLINHPKPANYNPINHQKKRIQTARHALLRYRAFRHAVIEAYDCRCAACGLKLASPDGTSWEVQAAHVVPSSAFGRDDIWNSIALCRFHHWAFDVGWFTVLDNFGIQLSNRSTLLPSNHSLMGRYDCLRALGRSQSRIHLPAHANLYPDTLALLWHRQNVFANPRPDKRPLNS